MPRVIKWSKELVVEKIKVLYSKGKDLSYRNIHLFYRSLQNAGERYFGSWRKSVGAAGIDYSKTAVFLRQRWNKGKIISAIKWRHKNNERLNPAYLCRNHRALYGAACHHFGSWKSAVEKAGIDYSQICPPQIKKGWWSKKRVAARIRKLAQIGVALSYGSISKSHPKLYGAACRCCGGWSKAIEMAGLDYGAIRFYRPPRIFKTKKDVTTAIIERRDKGLPLNSQSLASGKHHDQPMLDAARKMFKSGWKEALLVAGLDPSTIYLNDQRWTPSLVLKEITTLKQKGERLNAQNIKRIRKDLMHAGVRYFGTWGQAVEAAGMSYQTESIKWTYKAWLKTLTPEQLATIDQQAREFALTMRRRKHERASVKGAKKGNR